MKEIEMKDELRNLLSLLQNGYSTYKLLLCDDNFDSYFIVDGEYRGVGIIIDEKFCDFKYHFENIIIKVEQRKNSDRENQYFIQLLSNKIYDVNEFIFICMSFIDPGVNGENRKLLLTNPQEWVNKWKKLLGNEIKEEEISSKVGELLALKYLLLNGANAELTFQGSHDIETLSENYEIKTTTMRYDSLIEIHSKNQLASLNGNPLYLIFIRLEESIFGISLKSLLKDLENLKYNTDSLKLKYKDFNSETLDKKYKVDEMRLYAINDKFPRIIDDSFKDNHIPVGIMSLTYLVDLTNLDYIAIDCDFVCSN